jgi:hypothetical protein
MAGSRIACLGSRRAGRRDTCPVGRANYHGVSHGAPHADRALSANPPAHAAWGEDGLPGDAYPAGAPAQGPTGVLQATVKSVRKSASIHRVRTGPMFASIAGRPSRCFKRPM